MVVHQLRYQDNSGWDYSSIQGDPLDYQLIIVFGSRELLGHAGWFQSLRKKFLKIIRENLPNPPLFWKSTKTRELRKIHSGNSKAMHNLNQPNNLNQQT